MTETTAAEQFAELDPLPTSESVASPMYGEDDKYYRCAKCNLLVHATADVPDDHEFRHPEDSECDGKYKPVSRQTFLEHDDATQAALADATRAWYEARSIEPPE